ncbi:hypothetical protein ASD83_08160 [Devosia sp. Root685]|uniref:hypothetical protein n=1 Tax=Devosia sp. Root685 TaxID=1736587 RepID=UPI0006F6F238|nr:hypothetical protein [Devosia sp. Root685]KRB01463.1 hypothetical protein ASD83_08160 [Devosia sp. Root685]
MNLPTLPTLLSLITAAFVLSLASVRADGFDPSKLLILGDDNGVRYEDWVSTDPLDTQVVKKIEGGRVSYVTIKRTSTGTYSSDGIESPHVQYPGVIEPDNPRNSFSFSSWNNGQWTRLKTYSGNSYVSISTYKTHRGETRTSTCISTASYWYC